MEVKGKKVIIRASRAGVFLQAYKSGELAELGIDWKPNNS